MRKGLFAKIFGTHSERELKSIEPIADKIMAMEDEYRNLDDAALKAKTAEFKDRLAKGETLDDILPEAYALVREAADRVLGKRPFRVQLMGGILLHQGRIAEMKTGEGKTLVATLPVYLNALTGKGVISGDGTGRFNPNDNVTREQFLKMLVEAAEIEAEEGVNTFADVKADAWYKSYVLKAKNFGIVNGISDTEFGIGTNITRQDMAVMITRTIEKLGITIEVKEVDAFADKNKVSDYATKAVEYMKSIGLIEGYNNEYRPLDNLTRAEAAKVIAMVMDIIK